MLDNIINNTKYENTGNLILIQDKYKNLFEPLLKDIKDMYDDYLSHLEVWDWGDSL
tara:strand:- start:936 stop:1103 length:168 start_codon:yes stop_codon:yes gene_type:complete